jgi:hypothetical protein
MLFQLGDARLELGDALVLGPALPPPAVPDPALELHRGPEHPPVLGLDPRALLLGSPQLSDWPSEPSIWMRLGSCTAAAPATLTSSTPSWNRALMLLSSVPCGNDMLLRKDP